jgi:Flp pilus assembly protein TadD
LRPLHLVVGHHCVVIGARQAHEVSAATSIISGSSLSPAQAHRADLALNRAATLNPDRHVDVLRGELATAQGQNARARSTLRQVILDEPKDLEAWLAYARASSDNVQQYFAAQIGIKRFVRLFPTRP